MTASISLSPVESTVKAAEHHVHQHACANCEAALTGPYCAQCGQHAHASARDLHAVLHDAWHELTHLDGRLWHTLWLLIARPGALTVEYFQERRARYLPPIRLYLIVSLVFFSFSVGHGNKAPIAEAGKAAVTADAPGAKGAAVAHLALPDSNDEPDLDRGGAAAGTVKSVLACDLSSLQGWHPAWMKGVAQDACVRIRADSGEQFLRTLGHNLPKMMFVFLPLMAAVMLGLYWRPRRFYVEHLIYLLQNHSALFLLFSLIALVDWIADGVPALSWLGSAGLAGAVAFYAIWYPYKSMRRYYGQSRGITLIKFALIGAAYLVCLLLTLAGTAVISVLET